LRKTLIAGAVALLASALLAASAMADFGIRAFDVQVAAGPPPNVEETRTSAAAGAYTQAGGHPYAIVTRVEWNSHPDPSSEPPGAPVPDGDVRDTVAELPLGLVGNPGAYARCTTLQLSGRGDQLLADPAECPADSQVGVIHVETTIPPQPGGSETYPIFNMTPAAGEAARFGFDVGKTLVFFSGALERRDDGSYGIALATRGAPQALRLLGAEVTFWGVPADERHFVHRCSTFFGGFEGDATASHCTTKLFPQPPGNELLLHSHHASVPAVPLLTMPTSCTAPGEGQAWTVRTSSWEDPGAFEEETIHAHLPPYAPEAAAPGPEEGTTGCDRVPFNPQFTATPTQQSAAGPSGLNIHLALPQAGLLNPAGIAQSHLEKAVVTLPEGMTINPSQAEGLGVCTPAEFGAISTQSFGCPSTAKIGSVEVRTPLLEETIPGNVYVAEPYKNPSKSLIALYIVLREPGRGISIGLAGKVAPDPKTGQLVTTFDQLPQVPFESFDFKFREGPRAPLITPSRCGRYGVEADFYPWARPQEPVHTVSSFEVLSGPGGGACPADGVPPFQPGFTAGSLNNNAGSYSPFLMRLTRADGEQDLTKFSAVLPPGVAAKIAGVGKCSDSAIALAAEKSGLEEVESPSCPLGSEVGSVVAGAGVGSTLVYVPGRLYFAGPYNGAPFSIVAVTPAVAGPFDLGTVVVRVALSLDPLTGEVHVDGDRSDPIPHILQGIPLSLRDLRVAVDRDGYTINPTNCDRFSVRGTLFGSYLDFLDPADDVPVGVSNPYQAANCLNLGFKPRLSLKLLGGTKRGDFPALRAVLRPRVGDANARRIVVSLPHSAFLEQGHIRTICTRVQFAADACPAGSVYGHARAWSPLLDEVLEGPVYLRSNGGDRDLPDMVLALHGLVDIDAVGWIDTDKKTEGIRSTFNYVPDAPLSKVVLSMQGGKKGLIVNSTDLCRGRHRVSVQLDGQNGKAYDFRAPFRTACKHR
jgi:hypothetical protein